MRFPQYRNKTYTGEKRGKRKGKKVQERRRMEACERDLVEGMESMAVDERSSRSAKIIDLLRRFLGVQQRRAEAYAKLRRYPSNQ